MQGCIDSLHEISKLACDALLAAWARLYDDNLSLVEKLSMQIRFRPAEGHDERFGKRRCWEDRQERKVDLQYVASTRYGTAADRTEERHDVPSARVAKKSKDAENK